MDVLDLNSLLNAQGTLELPPEFLSLLGGAPINPRMQEFVSKLPTVTEAELNALGHKDSMCPVCFVPFLAVLAEEEMAHAMDSPAHASADLGVTRIAGTCGHLFCRKDISKWINEGHASCPSCRTPFLPPEAVAPETQPVASPPPSADASAQAPPPASTTAAATAATPPTADAGATPSADEEEQAFWRRAAAQGLFPPDEAQEIMARMQPLMMGFQRAAQRQRPEDEDRSEYSGMYS